MAPLLVRTDFREGDEDSNFSIFTGGSLNRRDLFTELPFLQKSLPNPPFTKLPPPLLLVFPGFSVQGMVLVNPFLRFTKSTDFLTKILGLKRASIPE